jgi:hypothetical protein
VSAIESRTSGYIILKQQHHSVFWATRLTGLDATAMFKADNQKQEEVLNSQPVLQTAASFV